MFNWSSWLNLHPRKTALSLSPWLLMGLTAILALAITVLAVRNTEREKSYITQNLVNRADTLIWALEAGTRSMMSSRALLQSLVAETARQPGIEYLRVADSRGRIIADNNENNIGTILANAGSLPAPPADTTQWRLRTTAQGRVFEADRLFFAVPMHHQMGGMGESMSSPDDHDRVFVGLDPIPLEQAFAGDLRNNLFVASLVALLGFGGFISLFWAHNYQRSNRMLKESQALAAEVVTSLPIGLLTSDPADNIVMVNDAAAVMFGLSRDQCRGMPLFAIGGLDWVAIRTVLLQQEKIMEKEVELIGPQENHLPVSLSASRILNEEGRFLGSVFILRDLSEVRKLQLQAQRNERLTAIGHLAAGIAHEIRNPLSSIKGLATYLLGKFPQAGTENTAAKTMITEVDRLNRVVSALLDFARPEVMVLTDADINDVINVAVRLAATDAAAKDIHLLFTPNSDLPPIPLNSERFTQAMLNLLLNAIQSMKSGGYVTLTAVVDEKNERLAIAVADVGPGMSQTTLSSLFTPYFTTKSSGTGLGLAIVHQIVKGHGGDIIVSSRLGEGTKFTLLLPLGKTPQQGVIKQ
jgi:two-component system sensor histidine kinase HydH